MWKKLYNNGINSADNMAVLAKTDLVSVFKAEFVGKLIMLYAVSPGLPTCWFGHYRLAELATYFPAFASDDRLQKATMGYGYGRHVDVGGAHICCMTFGHRDETIKRPVDVVAG